MPTHRQVLLPSGVIIVAGQDTDAALTAAARLVDSGVHGTALVAAAPGTSPQQLAADLGPGLHRHRHVVVVATTPTAALTSAAVLAARSLGRAATVLTAGDAGFCAAWHDTGMAATVGADRVVTLTADLDLLPYASEVDLRRFTGRFAVVGDVHGCQRTLTDRLLPALDWSPGTPDAPLLVSVGDVHDKGVRSVESLRWWLAQMRAGAAVMTDSNHARALVRALVRPDLPVRDCVAETVTAIDAAVDAEQLRTDVVATFGRLPTHLVLPGVVAAHAAMTEPRLWRTDMEARRFAIHTRYHLTPWHWTGSATLVHGHDTVAHVTTRRARTSRLRPGHVPGPVVNVDTGAYAGGGLSAYRSWTGDAVTVPTVDDEITAVLRDEMSPVCA